MVRIKIKVERPDISTFMLGDLCRYFGRSMTLVVNVHFVSFLVLKSSFHFELITPFSKILRFSDRRNFRKVTFHLFLKIHD